MVVLLTAGLSELHLALPISIAVALLMAIVIASYRQTVRAYEVSGGAYVVARENLGRLPSLVAAAALLVDYVLTVAVSVSSGVLAITSAVSSLNHYNTQLSLAAVALITLVNLRGVRESGLAFALPTYLFIGVMFIAIGTGLTKCATSGCPQAITPHAIPPGASALGIFLILKAFSSGASALTGVEAIANGVNAFKRPQAKNAARTLGVLGIVAITMFIGVSYLAVETHARPSTTDSVVSQVARGDLPGRQHRLILLLARPDLHVRRADPRREHVVPGLSAAVGAARARSLHPAPVHEPRRPTRLLEWRHRPRRRRRVSDRIYHANVNNLIHLYVIGVFTAFTLSQTGMVRYWLRTHGDGWRWRAPVNGVGAVATCVVTVVVILTKFGEGAWIVTVAVPLMVAAFYGVRRHYEGLQRRLSAGAAAVAAAPAAHNRTLLVVESLDEATETAAWLADKISPDGFRAIHVPLRGSDRGSGRAGSRNVEASPCSRFTMIRTA